MEQSIAVARKDAVSEVVQKLLRGELTPTAFASEQKELQGDQILLERVRPLDYVYLETGPVHG